MPHVRLGRSGLKVSRICLGTMSFGRQDGHPWMVSEEEGRPIILRALELGINFFDTADVYSNGLSEEILGKALRDFAARDEVVLATKVNGPMGRGANDRGLSKKHILQAVDASLKRLRTEYIDLYQIHRWDSDTPIEETLVALHELVKGGKVRYVGASSMFAWQFTKSLYLADLNGWTRFVSMQNHYNLVYREEEREMIPLCASEGIGVLPWSPLAKGFLAGNRRRKGWGSTLRAKTDDYAHRLYFTSSDFDVVDTVVQLASMRDTSPAQIALAWLLHQPFVASPVIGVTRLDHLEDAVCATAIRLTDVERRQLEEPYRPHPVLGHP